MSSLLRLSEVAHVLDPVADKYFEIGVQLDLKVELLRRIEGEHLGHSRRLYETIHSWQENFSTDHCSWFTLADAVSRVGGHDKLAEELRKRARQPRESEDSAEDTGYSTRSDSPVNSDTELSSGSEAECFQLVPGCGCKEKPCSLNTLCARGCPNPTRKKIHVLQKKSVGAVTQDDLPFEDEDDGEDHERETKQIHKKFGKFVTDIFDSFEKQNVKIPKLVLFLQTIYPVLKPRMKELNEATCLKQIFSIVVDQACSWFDYELIKDMIDNFGDLGDKHRAEVYEEEFRRYAEQRLPKGKKHIEVGSGAKTGGKQLVVKIDKEWEEVNFNDLDNLRGSFASILGVRRRELYLADIREGCIMMTFMIREELARELFSKKRSLTASQIRTLKGEGMISMKCDKFVWRASASEKSQEQIAEEMVETKREMRRPCPPMSSNKKRSQDSTEYMMSGRKKEVPKLHENRILRHRNFNIDFSILTVLLILLGSFVLGLGLGWCHTMVQRASHNASTPTITVKYESIILSCQLQQTTLDKPIFWFSRVHDIFSLDSSHYPPLMKNNPYHSIYNTVTMSDTVTMYDEGDWKCSTRSLNHLLCGYHYHGIEGYADESVAKINLLLEFGLEALQCSCCTMVAVEREIDSFLRNLFHCDNITVSSAEQYHCNQMSRISTSRAHLISYVFILVSPCIVWFVVIAHVFKTRCLAWRRKKNTKFIFRSVFMSRSDSEEEEELGHSAGNATPQNRHSYSHNFGPSNCSLTPVTSLLKEQATEDNSENCSSNRSLTPVTSLLKEPAAQDNSENCSSNRSLTPVTSLLEKQAAEDNSENCSSLSEEAVDEQCSSLSVEDNGCEYSSLSEENVGEECSSLSEEGVVVCSSEAVSEECSSLYYVVPVEEQSSSSLLVVTTVRENVQDGNLSEQEQTLGICQPISVQSRFY